MNGWSCSHCSGTHSFNNNKSALIVTFSFPLCRNISKWTCSGATDIHPIGTRPVRPERVPQIAFPRHLNGRKRPTEAVVVDCCVVRDFHGHQNFRLWVLNPVCNCRPITPSLDTSPVPVEAPCKDLSYEPGVVGVGLMLTKWRRSPWAGAGVVQLQPSFQSIEVDLQ